MVQAREGEFLEQAGMRVASFIWKRVYTSVVGVLTVFYRRLVFGEIR
jgi:hypothetical protein